MACKNFTVFSENIYSDPHLVYRFQAMVICFETYRDTSNRLSVFRFLDAFSSKWPHLAFPVTFRISREKLRY